MYVGWNGAYLYFSETDPSLPQLTILEEVNYKHQTVCLPAGIYTPFACGGEYPEEVTWEVHDYDITGAASVDCMGPPLGAKNFTQLPPVPSGQPSGHPSSQPTVQPTVVPPVIVLVTNVTDATANASVCSSDASSSSSSSSCNLRSAVAYCVQLQRNTFKSHCVIQLPTMADILIDLTLGEMYIDTSLYNTNVSESSLSLSELTIEIDGRGATISPLVVEITPVNVSCVDVDVTMYDSYGDGKAVRCGDSICFVLLFCIFLRCS
jgi:hypothetical protein